MNFDRANTMLAQAARILEHVQGRRKEDERALLQVRSCIDAALFALLPEQPTTPEPVGVDPPGTMSARRAAWDGRHPTVGGR